MSFLLFQVSPLPPSRSPPKKRIITKIDDKQCTTHRKTKQIGALPFVAVIIKNQKHRFVEIQTASDERALQLYFEMDENLTKRYPEAFEVLRDYLNLNVPGSFLDSLMPFSQGSSLQQRAAMAGGSVGQSELGTGQTSDPL